MKKCTACGASVNRRLPENFNVAVRCDVCLTNTAAKFDTLDAIQALHPSYEKYIQPSAWSTDGCVMVEDTYRVLSHGEVSFTYQDRLKVVVYHVGPKPDVVMMHAPVLHRARDSFQALQKEHEEDQGVIRTWRGRTERLEAKLELLQDKLLQLTSGVNYVCELYDETSPRTSHEREAIDNLRAISSEVEALMTESTRSYHNHATLHPESNRLK